MRSHADVKEVSARISDHVLVHCNARSLQRLTGQLLIFIANQMGRARVLITWHLLLSDIENSDLRIRYTTAIPGLRVRLVLVVSVALRRSWQLMLTRNMAGISEEGLKMLKA